MPMHATVDTLKSSKSIDVCEAPYFILVSLSTRIDLFGLKVAAASKVGLVAPSPMRSSRWPCAASNAWGQFEEEALEDPTDLHHPPCQQHLLLLLPFHKERE